MTQPAERSPIGQGTDITVGPEELEETEAPATSDPEEMNGDEELGGVGGGQPGGAG